ncbi:MAG: hypothetical protein QF371_05030 [Flavobacteriales bacterium]|nr:hypothetical protein [Flavobacteriales bacterium]
MNYEQLPEIPEAFFNSDTDAPFTNCMVCECDLMEETEPYSIERAIRHYPEMKLDNVVFEYALCAKCTSNMENEISRETMFAIMTYFSENFDHSSRPTWKPGDNEHPFECDEWIGNCAVKNLPKGELFEYSLYARCIGDRIIPEVVPYMISGIAQDDLIELFSNKSLGFLDDFTDKHFSGPPELKELFKGRPILV